MVDTSPLYIEMCRKADELQESHVMKLGDYIYNDQFNSIYLIVDFYSDMDLTEPELEIYIKSITNPTHDISIAKCGTIDDSIFLFRQDQLQGMFLDKCNPHNLIVVFEDWRLKMLEDILHQEAAEREKEYSQTFEQLWLRFTMYKKFNKIWNGENWITKNN